MDAVTKPLPLAKNATAAVNAAAEAVFRNNPRLLGMFLDVWKSDMPAEPKTRLLEQLALSIQDNSKAGELLLLVGVGQVQRADERLMDFERETTMEFLRGSK